MSAICPYFQVHQPLRIKEFNIFDVGKDRNNYFDYNGESELNNEKVLRKVANKCYLPANEIILKLLKKHKDFKVSYSISGVLLEQLESNMPEVIESFQKLVNTGKVELLAETYYHSLSYFYSKVEFERQVKMHEMKIMELFGIKPQVFRNTELAYTNSLGLWCENAGYNGILAEGWDYYLGWRSPNFVYKPKGGKDIKLLLKNYRLSDDVAFRFSEESWEGWPLTSDKYSEWVSSANGNGDTVNLFLDYETFGEHQWKETGIFDFLSDLPEKILRNPDNIFKTPSEVINDYPVRDEIDVPYVMTWADLERDLSAWTGNEMQNQALEWLYSLEDKIGNTCSNEIIADWRRLQTSDHFYYMCTKWFNDGDVHAYFNPYKNPHDAFTNYMKALKDLELRANNAMAKL